MIGRDIMDHMAERKSAGKPFAVATVVRTVSVTAAKAGAKAVIRNRAGRGPCANPRPMRKKAADQRHSAACGSL